ncbi:MAG: hypothetical protein QM594_22825 [Niabella sp.]
MKRLLVKTNRTLLLRCGLYLLFGIATACNKEAGYKKVIAEVGFPSNTSSVDIPDNVNAFTNIELDISGINDAVAYDVYFTFDNPAVVGQQIRTGHPTYRDPATGILYYRIIVARGVRKAALALIPNNRSTGNLTFGVTLAEDVSGNNNYTLKQGKQTFNINYIDN